MIEPDNKSKEEVFQEQPLCFFENKKCNYFPCHTGLKKINCLFCFCPLYTFDDCGGTYTSLNGIKDCSECLLPHKSENYYVVIRKLVDVNRKKNNQENADSKRDISDKTEQMSYLEITLKNIE